MRLNKLRLSNKGLFDRYLGLKRHSLAVYNFANIYIWRKLFDIRWLVIEKSLCVFFEDRIGSFLYLAPLSAKNDPAAIAAAFKILEKRNKNVRLAHIENIEEEERGYYTQTGLSCELKSYDYLCQRADLARLSGNRFKSKRSSCNYFTKHNVFSFTPLALKDRKACLKLYKLWAGQRRSANTDSVYQGMLADSLEALKQALNNYAALGLEGRVVRIGKEIKGFTFGFSLNPDTFCILYEVTDLSVKGLAQFIFRSFAQELKNYRYINIADDSGLENLKKVKLSYHPHRLVPAYIARRK